MFVFTVVVGLVGRFLIFKGNLRYPDPKKLYKYNLHQPEWEFKKDFIYYAGTSFKWNTSLVNSRWANRPASRMPGGAGGGGSGGLFGLSSDIVPCVLVLVRTRVYKSSLAQATVLQEASEGMVLSEEHGRIKHAA